MNQTSRPSHKESLKIIDSVRDKVKQSDVYKDMCNEYEVDEDYIYFVPMAFDDMDVSARTNKGCIYFNFALLEDGDFEKEDHYMIHELTHHFQQCHGDGPTQGSTKDSYLDNEYEQEGFQAQTEYLSETRDDEAAKRYVTKVLNHHDVPDEEREERRKDLLHLATNIWLRKKIAEEAEGDEEEIEIPDFAKEYPKWPEESVEEAKREFVERTQRDRKELKELVGPGEVVAYHGGRNFEGGFSTSFSGSGEGTSILGPGVYFITNKEIAKRYCKYVDASALYTVHIQTSGLYNPTSGMPVSLRNKLLMLADEVQKERGLSGLPSGRSLEHGKGTIGDLVRLLGPQQVRSMLVDIGITGAFEKLEMGYEIAVYDPSIVTIVGKEECVNGL